MKKKTQKRVLTAFTRMVFVTRTANSFGSLLRLIVDASVIISHLKNQ